MRRGLFQTSDDRRAQTRAEALIALALLIIAGLGVWALYRDQIINTTKAMFSAF